MTKRVLIAGFKHETNTFSRVGADLDAYRARLLLRGAEVAKQLTGTRTEVAGFLDAARRHGWEVATPVVADATPSGPVTAEAFRTIVGEIVAAARDEGPFHGVLLNLHGAMVTELSEDGEGAILAALREALGSEVPIAATLDLHANVTDAMAELANILISYRTYPHIDQFEVATEAAELLARAMDGAIAPRTVVARGAMIAGVDHGRTTAPGPMLEVQAIAAAMKEANPGILSFSINAGFPPADIAQCGPSAVIVGDGDSPALREAAEKLVGEIWQRRHRQTVRTLSVAEAMRHLAENPPSDRPTVIADFADNPGGGGYGDATALLRALIDANIPGTVFATIHDPQSARACHAAGVGATVALELGGKVDPALGAPIPVRGRVERLTDGRFAFDGPMQKGVRVDMGPTAVLAVGNVRVVLASRRFQALDRQFFLHAGIDPARERVVALKSAQHFRAAFAPIAGEILVVDAGGGLTSEDLSKFSYRRVRRPVFPLDLD
ncbi:MAG TPA: M81 family metallopeptidase [Burkholderiaceae bacterium]